MHNDANGNGTSSAATSAVDPDMLAHEAAAAEAAIRGRIEELKRRIGETSDLQDLVRKHPWLSLAAASAVGVFAARSTFAPRPTRVPDAASFHEVEPTQEAAAPPAWWFPLVAPLFDVFKVAVEQLLRHAFAARSSDAAAESPPAADDMAPETNHSA
jgi:hypothetical protein